MTKEKFLYGLNACAVTYHNGQKLYEHDELVKCFEDLGLFEQEPNRQIEDYENEIEDLHNRLDIAEYDKERLREEVTNLEAKIKALEQEPKTGQWITKQNEVFKYYCDKCGTGDNLRTNYCPNCGAKMVESEGKG